MLVFLMPADVRKSIKLPPGVITAGEDVLGAYGSVRGRDRQTTENSSAAAPSLIASLGRRSTSVRRVIQGDDEREQLLNLIERKAGGPIACPVCGTTEWVVYEEDPVVILMPADRAILPSRLRGEDRPEDQAVPSPGSIAALHASCQNCGFMRLHNVDGVLSDQVIPEDEPSS